VRVKPDQRGVGLVVRSGSEGRVLSAWRRPSEPRVRVLRAPMAAAGHGMVNLLCMCDLFCVKEKTRLCAQQGLTRVNGALCA